MIQAFRNNFSNNISSYIEDITPFTIALNWDFTMELPQTRITTLVSDFVPGEKIILVDDSDPSREKQIMFMVRSVKRNYEENNWELDCPHALHILSDLSPAFDFNFPSYGGSWNVMSDYTPMGEEGYQFYNNQMQAYSGQGAAVWERSYVQALFLIKALIHRATGVSVLNIDDSSVAEKESFYHDTYSYYGQEYATPYLYSELGVSVNSLIQLGWQNHEQSTNSDLFARESLPSYLDVLRLLCQALFITIDICRADYQLRSYNTSSAPSAAQTQEQNDETIERMRRLGVKVSGLPDPDYIYGTWNAQGLYVPYSYGVQNSDLELITRKYDQETNAETTRTISITWPNHFRLYAIELGSPGYLYRSKIKLITDTIKGHTDHHMWLQELRTLWDNIAIMKEFTTLLPGIVCKYPRCTIDIPNDTLKYHTWSLT